MLAAAANLVSLLLLLHLSFFDPNHASHIRMFLAAEALIVLLTLVAAPILWLRFQRLMRALDRNEGRLCTECGYPLAHSPQTNLCPECGQSYDLHHVLDRWRRTGWHPPPPQTKTPGVDPPRAFSYQSRLTSGHDPSGGADGFDDVRGVARQASVPAFTRWL